MDKMKYNPLTGNFDYIGDSGNPQQILPEFNGHLTEVPLIEIGTAPKGVERNIVFDAVNNQFLCECAGMYYKHWDADPDYSDDRGYNMHLYSSDVYTESKVFIRIESYTRFIAILDREDSTGSPFTFHSYETKELRTSMLIPSNTEIVTCSTPGKSYAVVNSMSGLTIQFINSPLSEIGEVEYELDLVLLPLVFPEKITFRLGTPYSFIWESDPVDMLYSGAMYRFRLRIYSSKTSKFRTHDKLYGCGLSIKNIAI